jgi:hypothetical protein
MTDTKAHSAEPTLKGPNARSAGSPDGTLGRQLVLPGGASTARLTDILSEPASTALSRGDGPPAPGEDHSPPPEVLDVRVLEEVEARALAESEEQRKYRPKVALDAADKMRTRHHAIARLLAAGRRPSQIAQIMDCTPTSIAQLERSPAFQSLVLEYMQMLDKSVADSYLRMKVLGNVAIDEATNRVLTTPETIETKDLLKIVEVAADRTGLGVSTTRNVNVSGLISPADIRAAKAGLPPPTIISQEGDPVEDSGSADHIDASVRGEPAAEQDSEGGDSVREEDNCGAEGEGPRLVSNLDLLRR